MRQSYYVDTGADAYNYIVDFIVAAGYKVELLKFTDAAIHDAIWHYTHIISVFLDKTETMYIIVVNYNDMIFFALADKFDSEVIQLPTGEYTLKTAWYKQEGLLYNKKLALTGSKDPVVEPASEKPTYKDDWGYILPSSENMAMAPYIYVENQDKETEKLQQSVVNMASYDLKSIVFTLNIVSSYTLWCNYNSNSLMFSIIERNKHTKPTSSVFICELDSLNNSIPQLCIGSNGDYSTFVYDPFDVQTASQDYPNGMVHVSNPRNIYVAAKLKLDSSEEGLIWYTNFGATRHELICSLRAEYWDNINTLDGVASQKEHFEAAQWKNSEPVEQHSIPTYAQYTSSQTYDFETANTLNGITLVMPLLFYAIREPHYKAEYSFAGKTDIIGYVSMANMSSGRFIQSSFPNKLHEYQCFNVGWRRMCSYVTGVDRSDPDHPVEVHVNKGFCGYVGIAFREESEEDYPEIEGDIIDWERMIQQTTDGRVRTIQMVDGSYGYNGLANFRELPKYSLLFKESYKNYAFLDIKVGNLDGHILGTVTLPTRDLAIGDESVTVHATAYNIISDITQTQQGRDCEWWIYCRNGSTLTDWVGNDGRNAVIVSAIGRN